MNVSEERKITAGTISGATLKSIDIEPSIIIEGKSYTASEFNKAVEMLKQSQLNDNQKIVLEWLKKQRIQENGLILPPIEILSNLTNYLYVSPANDKVFKSFVSLSESEQFEVLAAFAQWGLEQEESSNEI